MAVNLFYQTIVVEEAMQIWVLNNGKNSDI
jgi:hypothetical protein